MQTIQEYRLRNLDGLRGWAAVFVAMMHYPLDDITHQLPIISNGFLFVDLFFVLSGFVITYVYIGNFDKKKFFIARIARLAPLYFGTLAFAVVLEFIKLTGIGGFDGGFKQPNSLDGLLREFFLIHAFPMFTNTSFNPPNWSIAVESYVYILFALLSFLSLKRSFIIWAIFSIVSGLIIIKVGVLNDAHNLAIARGVLGFSLGVIGFLLWHFYIGKTNIKYLGDLGFLLIIFYIYFGGSLIFLPSVVMAIGVVMILIGSKRMHLSFLLENKISIRLGDYSFTIYMIHYFIAMRFEEIYSFLPSSNYVEVFLFFTYCTTVYFSSSIIYRYFEWPMRNYIRTRFR